MDDSNPFDGHSAEWWAYEAGKWKTRCEHLATDMRRAIEDLEEADHAEGGGHADYSWRQALGILRNAIKNAGFE